MGHRLVIVRGMRAERRDQGCCDASSPMLAGDTLSDAHALLQVAVMPDGALEHASVVNRLRVWSLDRRHELSKQHN